ncbi:MAG TPA: diguanylate cyclase [Terracidiphilus sp.]|nr:diguanylate cyclase [Terracidiphilus sp.]
MRKSHHPRRHLKALVSGCAVLFLCCHALLAQRYSFREYVEGLGNLNIACLAQDRTGYLWVGTQNGLYRYDGGQFQRYGEDQGLPQRMIQNLYVASDGTLWVATTSSIFYEKSDGKFAEVKPPAPLTQILQRAGTVLTSKGPDEVLAATRHAAIDLRRARQDEWKAETIKLEGHDIFGLLFGNDGTLWYGCDLDLCRMAKGKTTHVGAALKLPLEQWSNLLQARDGHIWLRGSKHIGELIPQEGRFILHDLPGPAFSEPYPELVEDSQGRILTSQGSSLGLWDKGRWRLVTEKNGLSRFEIQDLFVDREGSVWIGVVGHGLRRWVGQDRWEGYTRADGLSDDLVWDAARDHQGRLWIATESGLDWIPAHEVNPKVWQEPGIQTARAGSLEIAEDGTIWLGTTAGNLIRIDQRSLQAREWKIPEVFQILADKNHQVWAATSEGLYVMDTRALDKGPSLVEAPAFSNVKGRFTDLSADPAGHVWVAAEQGIFRLDGNGMHRIDPGASGAKPDLIAIDHDGDLWTAGPSQDLMRLHVSGDRVVSALHIERPQVLSQQIVSMTVDHRGWLWLGQDAGLTVFDGKSWHSFTQDDGLIWNDTDSYGLSEDADGSMWICTSGGLSHLIDPTEAPSASPRAPAFSKVTYGTEVLENGASAKWSSSPLDISMVMLSFKGTQDEGIRYRLIGGQGSDWEVGREVEVRYRHLTPGNYRFEVATADQSGNAVSPVAIFSFRIVPLWWQNRNLQIVSGVLSVLILVVIWRRRVGMLIRQKRQLEESVRMRTLDLEREKAQLVRTREQMRHFAEHDDLSGLWNHRIIVSRLRGEVERSRREGAPLSVILADLDFFKKINDTFGHPAGDLVLKEASAIFQGMVRSYDWVGRYGGEEFLLILPGSGFIQAAERAEELRIAIERARVVDGETTISVTASFGVASGFPTSAEELIREADAALYRAKKNGRNCVVATEIGLSRETEVQPF